MLDPVLLVALAMVGGALIAVAPLPASLAALAIAALLRRHAPRSAIVVALLVLAVNTARARAAIEDGSALHARVTDLLTPPARCEGEAVVIASPIVLRHGLSEGAGPEREARIDVAIEGGVCGDRRFEETLRARLYGAPNDLARGDRIELVADIAATHLFLNEGSRDPRPSIARTEIAASGGLVDARVIDRGASIGSFVDRARKRVRDRIDATFHPEAAPLARALVLGEVDLEADDDEAFRTSGLSHLLAVSGTHLVIAVLSVMLALRAILRRIGPLAARFDVGRLAALAAIPLAWIYADFAGGGGSATRAAAMLAIGMTARALGRRPSGVRAFALSMLIPAAIDPLVLCDASFSLSLAATAGLLFMQRPIAGWIVRGRGAPRKVLASVACTSAAMIACAPTLVMMSPTLPMLGVAANVVAAPIGEIVALPVCLAHACLAWAPWVERGAAILGSGALLSVREIARASGTEAATLAIPRPDATQLAALAVAAAAAWTASSRARRGAALAIGAAVIVLLEVIIARERAPTGVLRVTMLDVGQGDALAIDLPDGKLMLVDGGGFVGSPVDPGVRVILPMLRDRRRKRADIVVLSHPHPDHFTGLVSTIAAIEVGELWDTGQGEAQGAGKTYADLLTLARERGATVRGPSDLCGAPKLIGGATIEVLAPCPSFDPDVGANDNSLVLRIAYGSRAVLLTGDAEEHEEQALLRDRPERLRADLLKVGHHGSRTSTSPAFAAAVRPALALISSGVRNRFGHPHPIALGTLAALGIPALRTDRGGSIVWETDGDAIVVKRPALR